MGVTTVPVQHLCAPGAYGGLGAAKGVVCCNDELLEILQSLTPVNTPSQRELLLLEVLSTDINQCPFLNPQPPGPPLCPSTYSFMLTDVL